MLPDMHGNKSTFVDKLKSDKRKIIICISFLTLFSGIATIYHTSQQNQQLQELHAEEYTYMNSNTNEQDKTKYQFDMTNYLSRPQYSPMRATLAEIKEFIKHVTNKNVYIEWGSGGSTEIVPFLVTGHAYSLEHAVPWCKRMVTEIFSVHIAVSFNKLSYHCVDTKVPLRAWGNPDTDDHKKWKQMGEIYVNYIDSLNITKFDVFFIDGRFRVACALKIIKKQYYDEDSIVMIHDYDAGRRTSPEYHYNVVGRYYNKISCAESLCIFKPKQDDKINNKQLEIDFNKFIGTPG